MFNEVLETELILTWGYLKLRKTLTGTEISEETSAPSVISELFLLFPVLNLSQNFLRASEDWETTNHGGFCPC